MRIHIQSLCLMALMMLPAALSAQTGGTSEEIYFHNDITAIKLQKTVSEVTNDEFEITLEAFVTGQREVHEAITPADFELVLDVSGSMANSLKSGEYFPNYTHPSSAVITYNNYGYKSRSGTNMSPYVIRDEKGVLRQFSRGTSTGRYYVYIQSDSVMTINGRTGKLRRFLTSDGEFVWPNPSEVEFNSSGALFPLTSATRLFQPTSTDTIGVYDFTGKEVYTASQMDALKDAVLSFIDIIAENDQDLPEGYHHRIGLVKFGGASTTTNVGNQFSGNSNYTQVVANLTNANQAETLRSMMKQLDPGGATNTDKGMDFAKQELAKNSSSDRAKIVVLFTDGEPTSNQTFEEAVANRAIGYAKAMKDDGAIVYVIGMIETPSANAITFMEYTSSDYPTAESMSDAGDGKSYDIYYRSASTGQELQEIFASIADISSKADIGYDLTESNELVLDAISPSFMLPEDAVSGGRIRAFARAYTGLVDGVYTFATTEIPLPDVTINVVNKEIYVSNYDYSSNWCGITRTYKANGTIEDTYSGQEIVIKIPIIIDVSNPGGMSVITNEDYSGLYVQNPDGSIDKGNPLKPYPVPTVDIPNLAIITNGLAAGKTIAYRVDKIDDETGNVDANFAPYTVVVTSDGTPQTRFIKQLHPGRYKVSQVSSWNWSDELHPQADYQEDDNGTVVGTEYITRNVGSSTKNLSLNATVFEFSYERGIMAPPHAQAVKNNVFDASKATPRN